MLPNCTTVARGRKAGTKWCIDQRSLTFKNKNKIEDKDEHRIRGVHGNGNSYFSIFIFMGILRKWEKLPRS